MNETLLLKKYSNRRLYDTEKSTYVTLDHVMHAIRQGRRVAVADAKSGEDVTAFILTQIILEESRKKNSLLPVPLLHLIILSKQSKITCPTRPWPMISSENGFTSAWICPR
jgi:polyhydroxyalkanoate synthesis repressor PhaR